MLELRASNEDIVKPYSYEFEGSEFVPGKHPWEVKCDIALPCATENELLEEDARNLVDNGCICVCEGANMPCTPEAIELLQENKILYAPGKAANAGGVATSGLEMSQNSMKLNWQREEVDRRLHDIMTNIHTACVEHGTEPDGYVNYVNGANIAGFMKVANAMLDQGVV
jgi:glutamate dehydrogenase (NADP+)